MPCTHFLCVLIKSVSYGLVVTDWHAHAGVAAAVTAAKFSRVRMVQMPWVRWSNFALSGVSGAMVLFLSYNIVAGGNPMKQPEDASEEGDAAAIPAPAT